MRSNKWLIIYQYIIEYPVEHRSLDSLNRRHFFERIYGMFWVTIITAPTRIVYTC